jgi:universal stress protein A
MKTFKKILCPYDFSEHAEEALQYAIKLSDKETLITLIYVIQMPYSIDPYGYSYYDIKSDDIKNASKDALEKKVEELKSKYENINIDFEFDIDYDPAEYILKNQKAGHYDLVVIGSHGRKGISRMLMGSVAESVLREATCPVMIIKK